jgi:nucleoside-diphosphate-sugar epimerase
LEQAAMGRVAILGAGGFVGARSIEMAVLGGRADVVPVVRSYRSVARSAHLAIPHRLGDASRPESLRRALEGCEAVVNLTMGEDIARTTESIYDAAVAAGARLLVHLSSALVYGAAARPDLPDDAPPRVDHWMPYAREKARAELFLRERMAERRIAIVVLRPSLIWGPGSPWVLGPATELAEGTAYLIDGGAGICDLMYVDDLVRAIDAVVAHPEDPSGFYNVGDDEAPTWRAYYGALCAGLGVDPATIHRLAGGPYRRGVGERLEGLRRLAPYAWLKDRLALETREALKQRLARALGHDRAGGSPGTARPAVTHAMWDLQQTRSSLPTAKFGATFDVPPRTGLAAGMRASLAWLRFLGVEAGERVASTDAARDVAALA